MKKSKKNKKWPSAIDTAREGLEAIAKVKDIKQTLLDFDEKFYESPKKYTSQDIIKLRTKKLHVSQAVFAKMLNTTTITVQKWEQGGRNPSPLAFRLFQLMEKDAFKLIQA